MKILIVYGVRPDIINLSLLIPELERTFGKENIITAHTGQHYDWRLDGVFFEELGVEKPKHHLNMPHGLGQGQQTGYVMDKIEPIIKEEKPDLAISFSDANPSVFALTASKLFVKVLHIESGMRSYDWRMPEEKNRRVVDSIADYFFTPTEISLKNLIIEGHDPRRIWITSKLIFDVIENFKEKVDKSMILEELNLEPNNYFLCTLHRPENIEDRETLQNIINGLGLAYKDFDMKILASLHPRTQAALKKFEIRIPDGITITNSFGFFDFTKLEKNCFMGITDSGTVEEDLSWFRKPCEQTRISTARPETVNVGANLVVGGNLYPNMIEKGIQMMANMNTDWQIPYSLGATKKM
ncbi:MAG: UDP-N-acetylglucosamine 2-epimerase (non-hydrolyzing), partial [Nanoarchaeota archaeon]